MLQPSQDSEASRLFKYHLDLLSAENSQQEVQETITAPIFTMPVLDHTRSLLHEELQEPFPQYGLLAGVTESSEDEIKAIQEERDPRIFFNVAAPSSTFICGSQGSGKSHTLSCLLENCLILSDAGKLPKPLTGLVFHYDAFISDDGGSPCEAAFLSSNPKINVRVLCSPTNFRTIQRTYHALEVKVERLRIDPVDLNTKRMLDLMAVNQDDGPVPLYLHTVSRILRNMRVSQQETGETFDYTQFKSQVIDAGLTPAQLGPLNQRLDVLESFLAISPADKKSKKGKSVVKRGTSWDSKPGHLTIVDLSCPCVTPESACALFNICLSIFLEQAMITGRVIALDEAHKFMNTSAEALTFTNTLLSTIRLQRHLGARIIISTQEPSISPSLLDLCSVTIVHRFTSPQWLRSLKAHLAAAAIDLLVGRLDKSDGIDESGVYEGKTRAIRPIFDEIVTLKVGEALLFAPSAIIGMEIRDNGDMWPKRLGVGYLKIHIRERLTADGGKSVMADYRYNRILVDSLSHQPIFILRQVSWWDQKKTPS